MVDLLVVGVSPNVYDGMVVHTAKLDGHRRPFTESERA